MSTDLSRLRKAKAKGSPPAPEESADVTAAGARAEATPDQPLRPLQVRIPADVFEAFSETAGREFGFSHGAKKRLFLRMWEVYKAQKR